MCEHCIMEMDDLGEVADGLMLSVSTVDTYDNAKGTYGLIGFGNGPDVTFITKPLKNTAFGLSEEEKKNLPIDLDWGWDKAYSRFQQEILKAQLHWDTVYRYGIKCAAAGYDHEVHGALEAWLFHKMGEVVENAEKNGPLNRWSDDHTGQKELLNETVNLRISDADVSRKVLYLLDLGMDGDDHG